MSETDADGDGGLFTRDSLLLALVLFVGVAGTGVVRRQLGVLGYNQLGRYVFVLGYGGMVFVVWYGWIRPLDITGPTGNAGTDAGADTRTDDATAGTHVDDDADDDGTDDDGSDGDVAAGAEAGSADDDRAAAGDRDPRTER